jgi:hypothetical protein
MQKWLLVGLLVLQAHFAASYLVPLDAASQREFGGLLRWFWPWAYGDSGALGRITSEAGFPIVGFWIAMIAACAYALAILAVIGLWVPQSWARPAAIAGAAALVVLMALFFAPTKVIPIACAVGTIYLALTKPELFPTS